MSFKKNNIITNFFLLHIIIKGIIQQNERRKEHDVKENMLLYSFVNCCPKILKFIIPQPTST